MTRERDSYIYSWDAAKAEINRRKHQISFDEAQTIFNDQALVSIFDINNSNDEERWLSIGYSEKDRMLLVVHTQLEFDMDIVHIRIISARKTTKQEAIQYWQGGKNEK